LQQVGSEEEPSESDADISTSQVTLSPPGTPGIVAGGGVDDDNDDDNNDDDDDDDDDNNAER